MCNVHILDEGIDIPTCDSIYLTHPNNNPTNIIQRISRANRIDSNNKDKIAKIFLWTKDKMKLNNIIDNISTVITVKYGFMYHVPIENKEICIEDKTIIKQINNTMNISYIIDYYKSTTENIDDNYIKFIKFYEACEYNTFGIKLEDLLDLLSINDRNIFYDRFRKKFTVQLDYQIIRLKQKTK